MKKLLGLLLIFFGVVAGVYVGVWVCLVGGIVDIITQFQAEEIHATVVAWGVVKILFSGFLGWISAFVFLIPGMELITPRT